MAKQKRSQLTAAPLPQRMTFAGSSAGAIDETTNSLPPTSLAAWFADEAAVAAFSVPLKPQGAARGV
jgi:hypothetical protein